VDKIKEYIAGLLAHVKSNRPEIAQTVANQKVISPETEAALRSALEEYNQSAGYEIPRRS
jgi:hypothetical protein